MKGGRKVTIDNINSFGKFSEENANVNDHGIANTDSNGDHIVQPKKPTKRLVKQSKRKVELYRVIWRYCCRDDK
jgi:hypothetical protein